LPYKPKKIITIHKSNSGLFDEKSVVDELGRFAKETVSVAENGKTYELEEI
jgi:mRNA degradation ribonuclease J1/J2